MIDCISVENMCQSDAYTIANLVPGLKLMYRAAYGVFKAVNWHGRTAIVVGSGNNGGDDPRRWRKNCNSGCRR